MSSLKFIKVFFNYLFGFFLFIAAVVIASYMYYSQDLPNVTALKDIRLQTPMQILTADGELIASFGERRRIPLSYEEIPQYTIKAVIATEDSRFYDHYGIDPIGIMRAIIMIAKSGGFSQGGSTITQQVARNFFLTPEKHISRKIREMILAVQMEQQLSKKEILTLYLNKIYFGSRSYGIGAAAYTFFGKKASELTLSEAALLAGLPNAPSAYNPISYPHRALARRNWVLHRMLDQEYITEKQYNTAIKEPLNVQYHAPKIAVYAPYVAEMARQFMYERFGEHAYSDGYLIYTTITKKNQLAANATIHKHLLNYDMRHGYRGPEKILWKRNEPALKKAKILDALNRYMNYGDLFPAAILSVSDNNAEAMLADGRTITIPFEGASWARNYLTDEHQGPLPEKIGDVLRAGQQVWVRPANGIWWLSQIPDVNAALVSMNFETGAITALVGGFNFNISKFNRVTQAIRQVGSNIKPFIYTAALDKGLTMATILNDAPILRSNAGSEAWRPKNSPPIYDGPLRVRLGITQSKNVMMVRAVRAIGIDYIADYLQRFGFPKENISHNESLALGSAAFTPLQVARAYAVIANGGYLLTPYLIKDIKYYNGGTIYKHIPETICHNCAVQFGESDKNKKVFLDNVENAIDSLGGEIPEESNLNANSGLSSPDPDKQFENYPSNIAVDELKNEDNFPFESVQDSAELTNYAPHVISHELSFLMRSALKTSIVGEKGSDWLPTAWRSRSLHRSDIGGKTGTTNLSKDVWFSGFGNTLVTTVWMGFDDHRRQLGKAPIFTNQLSAVVNEGGAKTANPIWNDYMKKALIGIPEKPEFKPKNIIAVEIDKKTGLLPLAGSEKITEYFIKNTEPKAYAQKEMGTQIIDAQGNPEELF